MGFHHWREGNFHGADVLLGEGTRRLGPFAPSCHGVDVATLIKDAGAAHARLRELGSERMSEADVMRIAPRVRFAR